MPVAIVSSTIHNHRTVFNRIIIQSCWVHYVAPQLGALGPLHFFDLHLDNISREQEVDHQLLGVAVLEYLHGLPTGAGIAEITPESRRNHAEITPKSLRNHSEITPNHTEITPNHSESLRDHSEITPNHSEIIPKSLRITSKSI